MMILRLLLATATFSMSCIVIVAAFDYCAQDRWLVGAGYVVLGIAGMLTVGDLVIGEPAPADKEDAT